MAGISYQICEIMKMSGGATVDTIKFNTNFPVVITSPKEIERIAIFNQNGRLETLYDLAVENSQNSKIWNCTMKVNAFGNRMFVVVGYNKEDSPIARTSFSIDVTI